MMIFSHPIFVCEIFVNLSISLLNPVFHARSNGIQHAMVIGKIYISYLTPFITGVSYYTENL